MSYRVTYEPEALADLDQIPPDIRQRIIAKIDWLAENFEQIKPQPLSNNLSGYFKLRMGDYRVVYEFDDNETIIFIDRIGHRRQIYNEIL